MFKNANDELSRKASKVVRLLNQAHDECEDAKLFHAPSEIYHDIFVSVDNQIRDLFHGSIQEAIEFEKECENRTTPKFVYDMGLSVIQFFPDYQSWDFNY